MINSEKELILSNQDKHAVFRQAYLVSNQLIAWNVPVRLNSLPKQLKRETRERLFKHNLLDHYITQWLGDSAWVKGDYEKLTNEQTRQLAQLTAGQYLFITKLEQAAERKGELKRILKEHESKDMKELRSKWEVDDKSKEIKGPIILLDESEKVKENTENLKDEWDLGERQCDANGEDCESCQ